MAYYVSDGRSLTTVEAWLFDRHNPYVPVDYGLPDHWRLIPAGRDAPLLPRAGVWELTHRILERRLKMTSE